MKKRKEIVTQTKKHKFSKNLLIIESPNKIETINKFLKEKDFTILATIGHIRDLSSRGMGFDEKTLEPN
jgi:DNA topoisomerase-1